MVVVAVLVFIISNMACAVAVRLHQKEYSSIPVYLLYVRVAINDSLFVIFAIALSVCMFRMTKMSSSSLVLEAKVRPKHKKASEDSYLLGQNYYLLGQNYYLLGQNYYLLGQNYYLLGDNRTC